MAVSLALSLAAQVPPRRTDLTFITPYHWLIGHLKAKYPEISLYDIDIDD